MKRVIRNSDGRICGESHWSTRVPDATIQQLRDLHEYEGVSGRELARRFKLPWPYVQKVLAYTRRAFLTLRTFE